MNWESARKRAFQASLVLVGSLLLAACSSGPDFPTTDFNIFWDEDPYPEDENDAGSDSPIPQIMGPSPAEHTTPPPWKSREVPA